MDLKEATVFQEQGVVVTVGSAEYYEEQEAKRKAEREPFIREVAAHLAAVEAKAKEQLLSGEMAWDAVEHIAETMYRLWMPDSSMEPLIPYGAEVFFNIENIPRDAREWDEIEERSLYVVRYRHLYLGQLERTTVRHILHDGGRFLLFARNFAPNGLPCSIKAFAWGTDQIEKNPVAILGRVTRIAYDLDKPEWPKREA
ncbi:MAG: hypothetical protein M1377_00615 [Deltaproteobacteria bacterium]|nr:hypothetical protein [Deltaproteobacteria bacterium]